MECLTDIRWSMQEERKVKGCRVKEQCSQEISQCYHRLLIICYYTHSLGMSKEPSDIVEHRSRRFDKKNSD